MATSVGLSVHARMVLRTSPRVFQLAEQKGFGTQARASVAKVYSQLGGCTLFRLSSAGGGCFWKSDEALVARVRSEIASLMMP